MMLTLIQTGVPYLTDGVAYSLDYLPDKKHISQSSIPKSIVIHIRHCSK
jgi:hypothetical protein